MRKKLEKYLTIKFKRKIQKGLMKIKDLSKKITISISIKTIYMKNILYQLTKRTIWLLRTIFFLVFSGYFVKKGSNIKRKDSIEIAMINPKNNTKKI